MKNALALGIILALAALGCNPGTDTSEPTSTAAPAETPAEPAAAAPAEPASTEAEPAAAQPAAGEKLTIGVMPKKVGLEYFKACEQGAREAAAELGIELVYDGPVDNNVAKQSQMVDTWATRRFDAIAVAPNDPAAIVPALSKARKRGAKTLTWDADADPASRDFFVNQASSEGIAKALMDVMAEGIGENGKYIIITGSLTAANQNTWMELMEKYRQERYPNMINLSPGEPKASEEDQALATQVASDILKAYPDVQGIFAITSVALPGAAEALRRANAADRVFLTGLATPNAMRQYVKEGTVKKVVLWNAVDLGYLTVYASVAAAKGEIQPGAQTFNAGRLGAVKVVGDEILLGPPLVFDASNIDNYSF